MAVAQLQHIGAREGQEDSVATLFERDGDSSGDLLMLVADGMGGHAGGARASSFVIKTFRAEFLSQSTKQAPKERLHKAMQAANAALLRETQANPALKGMGTTLIAAWKHEDMLLWLSVGDSPMYIYRGGQLRRLNADHSFFGELMGKVAQGRLTLAEAQNHPKRNALRSALTGNAVQLVDVNHERLSVHDTLIVATDGLDTLEEPALVRTIEAYHRAGPQALCKKLIDATLDVGNPKQDNISLITYVHGAEDRTLSTRSNWTQMSLAGRVQSSWQIIALSTITALLIVTIAVMGWFKIGRVHDPVITETASVPTSEPMAQTPKPGEALSTSPESDTSQEALEQTPSQEDVLAKDPNESAADPQVFQGGVEDKLNAPASGGPNE
ncbi:PP2C family protein-serine/threonine phosphatase [Nereida sp. NH-UV-3]|uniref:PP2C family protein-serine/threonine phosphatase n=1 Tax=Nereida TaxID=282198 RepID=UPI0036F2FFB9